MRVLATLILLLSCLLPAWSQKKSINVIAYYSGGPDKADQVPAEKLSHIIFCFGHLQGNEFHLENKRDSTTIERLVALKKRNLKLKVILSLGGWGGCKTCSGVFATALGRHEFALSVLSINEYFKSDGIDLDWEYPAIEGYPDHPWGPADKPNFTELVKDLRTTLGKNYQISFAAGGFQKFLDESVDWKEVIPQVDRVNLMTYDLINGYSTQTGHHTALYSRPEQRESADNAVKYLIKIGVPANKLVIGSAFYGRMWEGVANVNHGLYQAGKFKAFIDYKKLQNVAGPENGFAAFWDDKAKAPYLYNADKQLFVTYDDKRSMALKTKYAIANHLDGIMFWELSGDADKDGLLDVIVKTKNSPHP
jgi:chitinase